MKKISICLFGRIHGLCKQFNFHKIVQSIYPDAEIDLYIHCWKYDLQNDSNFKYENDIDEIIQVLNPKQIMTENIANVKYETFSTCVYLLHSLQRSMKLAVSQNIEYDLCLCVRPDIIVNQCPDFNNILLKDGCVNMYSCPERAKYACSGICDWLYAGTKNTFEQISSVDMIFYGCSNESNIYRNFIKNGVVINIFGTINNGELAISGINTNYNNEKK